MRLGLIVLHVCIILFALINLHPHLQSIFYAVEHEKQLVAIFRYFDDIFRIVLYHGACIIAIWFCQSTSSSLIRATGILLITELLQRITLIIEILLNKTLIDDIELYFLSFYHLLLLITVILTFLFAENLAQTQMKLLTRTKETFQSVSFSQLKD